MITARTAIYACQSALWSSSSSSSLSSPYTNCETTSNRNGSSTLTASTRSSIATSTTLETEIRSTNCNLAATSATSADTTDTTDTTTTGKRTRSKVSILCPMNRNRNWNSNRCGKRRRNKIHILSSLLSNGSKHRSMTLFINVVVVWLFTATNNRYHSRLSGPSCGGFIVAAAEEPAQAIPMNNCDIDDYYLKRGGFGDDVWSWKREDVAGYLKETQSLLIRYDDDSMTMTTTNQDDDEQSSISFSSSSLEGSEGLGRKTVWDALIDLDGGSSTNSRTVNMIFTQTKVHSSPTLEGYEPGFLWPLQHLTKESQVSSEQQQQQQPKEQASSTTNNRVENEDEDETINEWIRAQSDLHNLRPRHSSIWEFQYANHLFYGECSGPCNEIFSTIDASNKQSIQSSSNNTSVDGMTSSTSAGRDENRNNNNNNSNHQQNSPTSTCACVDEHILQPPIAARGEIARALLYMDLRYGGSMDATTTTSPLDLTLTDCAKFAGTASSSKRFGFLSTLLRWHLMYPPSKEEQVRNDKVCQYYQGNRNPFVDFPTQAWNLIGLDNELKRSSCHEAQPSLNDTDNPELGFNSNNNNNNNNNNSTTITADVGSTMINENEQIGPYTCSDLVPGDINFFVVESGLKLRRKTAPSSSTDLNDENDLDIGMTERTTVTVNGEVISVTSGDAFGLVTLVGLMPGLELFVTDNAWTGTKFQTNEGTIRLTVPEGGISHNTRFGFGNFYLGDQWDSIEPEPNFSLHVNPNEGDQLFLYCFDETNLLDSYPYNVLAAISTTGKSFQPENKQLYWNDESSLPSNLQEDGYSVIILDKDASWDGSGMIEDDGTTIRRGSNSGGRTTNGYRYMGPIYSRQNQYAKALVNLEYWEKLDIFPTNLLQASPSNGDDADELWSPEDSLDGPDNNSENTNTNDNSNPSSGPDRAMHTVCGIHALWMCLWLITFSSLSLVLLQLV